MKNLIYISIITFLISCQSEKATQNISNIKTLFEKPIKSVDVSIQKNIVNSVNGDTLYLANDTRIIIPKNAFVDSLGNPIKGKVEINFQEYHTEAEVILSGIPMQYDSAGTEYTLETDGMFKISGKHKNNKVEIAPNKSLKVKTKSYKEDTPCFNYYTQNKKGEWSYNLSKKRTLNTEKLIEEEVAKIKTIDEKSVGIDFRVNITKNPELKDFKTLSWVYSGQKPDTLNFKLLSKVKWDDFDLVKTEESLYSYLLKGKSNRHEFKMPITLAFTEEELTFVKEVIAKKVREEELAYAKIKKDYEREATINNFGNHNWDRCVNTDMLVLETSLEHKDKIRYFYVINLSNKYRFVNKYEYSEVSSIRLLKEGNIGVIAFLEEEGKVAYALGSEVSEKINNGKVINLSQKTKTIKKPSDLQDIIDLI